MKILNILQEKKSRLISEHDKSRRVVQIRRCLLDIQEFGGLYVQVEWCLRLPGDQEIRRGSLIGKLEPVQQGQTSPELPNGGHKDLIQMC